MKSLADQIANKCVHFNGMQNKCCKAGVIYDYVKDESRQGFERFPCWKEGEAVPCDKRRYFTAEEVAEKVAEHERSFERLSTGMRAVQADARERGFKKGSGGVSSIACPCCNGGTLHYSVAGYNGHIHGKCTTPDCLSWMQ